MSLEGWIDVGLRLLAILSAPVVAYLAVRWALGRYKSEKSWELQSQAYIRALESLSVVRRYYAVQYDAYTAPQVYLGASEGLKEELRRALLELEKIASVGPYLLSAAAVDAINETTSHQYDNLNTVPEDYLESAHRSAERALEVVRGEAQKVHKAVGGLSGP
jgi:hypothetical protein